MKNFLNLLFLILIVSGLTTTAGCQPSKSLKIIIIRHGEKPDDGDNLNCQGFNRSLQLPKVIVGKFGVPERIFVPSLSVSKSTKHSRMFQTASPLAIKYNIAINTSYAEDDTRSVAQDIVKRNSTILLVWEHDGIVAIAKSLGVKPDGLDWPGNDYDSIWVITYKKGKAVLTIDKENINPSGDCRL